MCRSDNSGPPLVFIVVMVIAAPVVVPVVLVAEAWSWFYRVFFEPPNWPRDYSLGE